MTALILAKDEDEGWFSKENPWSLVCSVEMPADNVTSPPICLGYPLENKPLRINYTWQQRNTLERLGLDTEHDSLCLLEKERETFQQNDFSLFSSAMCKKTFVSNQSGIISCWLTVTQFTCVTSGEKRPWPRDEYKRGRCFRHMIRTWLSFLRHKHSLYIWCLYKSISFS